MRVPALSYDDTNYYPYMLDNGFAYKLVIGEDGKVWSWGLDPDGEEVTSRELDAIPWRPASIAGR